MYLLKSGFNLKWWLISAISAIWEAEAGGFPVLYLKPQASLGYKVRVRLCPFLLP